MGAEGSVGRGLMMVCTVEDDSSAMLIEIGA